MQSRPYYDAVLADSDKAFMTQFPYFEERQVSQWQQPSMGSCGDDLLCRPSLFQAEAGNYSSIWIIPCQLDFTTGSLDKLVDRIKLGSLCICTSYSLVILPLAGTGLTSVCDRWFGAWEFGRHTHLCKYMQATVRRTQVHLTTLIRGG